MSAEVLLYILTGWQPLPCCLPPEFPYAQLPAEKICELCYQQCEHDRQMICMQLQCLSGWQRHRLLELKCEADRLAATWYAAWWVTWSRATPEQRDEWVVILQGYTGPTAFWRGEVPMPLSLR